MIDSQRQSPEPNGEPIARMLAIARQGSEEDLGQLFEATRRYLLLVANRSLDAQLHPKIAPSDLVQETFLDAHRDFERFRGESEAELFAWLCHILEHKAADAGRRFRGTTKRNVANEQPLDNGSSQAPVQLAGPGPTPSGVAVRDETERRLQEAMARLPIDHRQVIQLRSFERLPFAEVGRRMGRSEDAAGKLWFRAIQKLRDTLAAPDDSGFALS